jgi:4-amino-4-deoxy-L-arabinose transferase-like glycosyltransferase
LTEKIEKYPIVTLSIVVFLMLLIHLEVPNITIMEARNFITAREIVNDNNWLLTTMNGEARYQKPPFPTWMTAISGLLLGINNVYALRLPAVLMVLFSGVFIYFLSLQLNLSKNNGLRNGLILVTSFYVFAIINEAPWDIYTHGFMLAGLYFLIKIFKKSKRLWENVLLSAFFIGLSILSKGPVSIYTMLLPFLISYGLIFKFKDVRKKAFPLIMWILLFIVIGGWWFVYVRLVDSEAFLEIATKETSNWSSYNVKPFYYYWSFFTQSGIWTIPALIGLLYPYIIKRVENKKVYKFSFWWTISAVLLLSLIPEKKPRYLVPVLVPLALNTGFYIQYLIKNFKKLHSKKEIIPVYFNFGLIAFIGLALPIVLYFLLKEHLQEYMYHYLITSVATVLIGVLIIRNLILRKFVNVYYLTIFFMVSLFAFGLPISKIFNKNSSYKSINSLHLIETKNNIKSYSIGEITPELLWDYNGILKNIYKNDELMLPTKDKFGLLVMNNDVKPITSKLNQKYNLELLATYDLNVGSKKKERLVRQFYLISKK